METTTVEVVVRERGTERVVPWGGITSPDPEAVVRERFPIMFLGTDAELVEVRAQGWVTAGPVIYTPFF